MELQTCYNEFIAFKKTYCAKETIDYYEENITKFLCFVSDQGDLKPDVEIIDLNTLYEYLYYLRQSNIKNTSVKTYFRAVKTFANWLQDENYIDYINMNKIKMPRSDASVKVPLTELEVKAIDSCFDFEDVLDLRNYCILHLMLDCGLRSGEVIRLYDDSFDFENNIIYIDGKGSKKRVVPLPEFLKIRLLSYQYLASVRGVFFRSKQGNPITDNAIKMFVRRLREKSGVVRLHPHLLRHTFATSYVLAGGNLEFLRLLMGHSSLEITQRYIHLANTAVIMKQDIYHLDTVFVKVA